MINPIKPIQTLIMATDGNASIVLDDKTCLVHVFIHSQNLEWTREDWIKLESEINLFSQAREVTHLAWEKNFDETGETHPVVGHLVKMPPGTSYLSGSGEISLN